MGDPISSPGETEADFHASLDLFDKLVFESAGIYRFTPRPYTPAAFMADDITEHVKTRRYRRMFAKMLLSRLRHAAIKAVAGPAKGPCRVSN